jgi:IS5 family transposase
MVSLHDPDARPIRKGKLGKPNEFGFVSQLAEVTENTKPSARGLILPASTELGNPAEETLLPGTIAELGRLGIRPREIAVDGAFKPAPTNAAFAGLQPKQVFIAGRQQPPPSEHSSGCGATGPGRRAGSVTSSAATAWTDPA